jgi:hypothetical protein
MKDFSEDRQCSVRESNRAPPECRCADLSGDLRVEVCPQAGPKQSHVQVLGGKCVAPSTCGIKTPL